MCNRPKSLMTHYIEGSIVSRELENMINDSAAEARFDAELSDLEFWADHAGPPLFLTQQEKKL